MKAKHPIDPRPSSFVGRGVRFLALSFFLASLAWHSLAGARYRRNINAVVAAADANDVGSLRGQLLFATVDVPSSLDDAIADGRISAKANDDDASERDAIRQKQPAGGRRRRRYNYKSIFHRAHTSLYYGRTNNDANDEESPRPDARLLEESEEEREDLAHELSIEVSFEDTYEILVFLGLVFVLGEVASLCGVPSLVGQIAAGFLLGPPLAEFVPFPEAMVLLGDLGLILLLVEAGIELDVGLVREAGVRPVAIAFVGSAVAFLVGTGVAFAGGHPVKSAIATGACFAPTSLGVAANALSGGKALNTPVGQLIVASAVIDDVIGLVILSMLDVLVAENPPLYEYFIPVISAVGYLVVLGGSAVTWIPRVVDGKILPLFKPERRQYVALALLWLLVMAYLPMMYYSKASHLTGAFLAGLSFSQVEGVHHTFIAEAGAIMEWLLRIFFSASIGFQVPIKYFGNSTVVAWGFAYYIAVLGKLPVGFFAPKYKEELPEDYPFNPYIRDVSITSVAMTCRGEFSFIIAAFGIGESLLDAELYSAIIFAVLLSSISSPIILTLILRHYNRRAAKYLGRERLDKSLDGGRSPLHVNIQIRSTVVPGMQTSIKNCANSLGLFVIDQRSWHPRGRDVVATELYAVDGKTMVDLKKSLQKVGSMELLHMKSENFGDESVAFRDAQPPIISEDQPAPGGDYIADRCAEIREALLSHPDLVDANVKVLQWVPLADTKTNHSTERDSTVEAMITGEAITALKNKETIDTLVDDTPTLKPKRYKKLSGPISFADAEKEMKKETENESVDPVGKPLEPLEEDIPVTQSIEKLDQGLRRRPRRKKTVSSPAVGGLDLWKEDSKAQDAAMAGAPTAPVQYDLQSGIRYGVARRQRMPSDLGAIAENTPLIEERLGGFVRRSISKESPTDSTAFGNVFRRSIE